MAKLNKLAIHEAIHSGDQRAVEVLVASGMSLRARDELGRTALHIAVELSDLPAVKMLIAAGADLAARDGRFYTPLRIAVRESLDAIVRTLLAEGARRTVQGQRGNHHLNSTDDTGWAPVHEAAARGDEAILRILVEAGADYNRRARLTGVRPLDLARKDAYRSGEGAAQYQESLGAKSELD